MTTLYLIRHGETGHNASNRIQGWLDVPLNETGQRQAARLGERFRGKPIAAVYSSDLMRARDTAQAVADVLGQPLILDVRLREYNMGQWTGLTGDEIAAVTPGFVPQGSHEPPIPDGETSHDMHRRIAPFLQELLDKHLHERVIAVSHGGTLGIVLATMLNMPLIRRQPFAFGNTAIAKATHEHGGWRLRSLNDQCHLRNLRLPTESPGGIVD